MTAINFNTENRTYRQLLGNGLTYRVPPFQRDYSWGEPEWEDLWADILGTLPEQGEPAHYMGYLVLQTNDNRSFEVIDGQQRLTTASLVVLAAMRLLKGLVAGGRDAGSNAKRLDQLRSSYIGYLDPVTLLSRNKLALNRSNDAYYRDDLAQLADRLPERGFPASTHAMRKAFEWFERKLRDHVQTESDQGMALARFVETMSDKLFFTVITVSDEINAYKVFETLNARGVRLSAADLLKNWLFSVLARSEGGERDLSELEHHFGGADLDPDSANYSLEHVLPRSPGPGWGAFHDRDLESFVFRIGNMVMLEAARNRDLANRPYAEKRPVLDASGVRLTARLAEENAEWNPERLDARQAQLARSATAVWRVERLSS